METRQLLGFSLAEDVGCPYSCRTGLTTSFELTPWSLLHHGPVDRRTHFVTSFCSFYSANAVRASQVGHVHQRWRRRPNAVGIEYWNSLAKSVEALLEPVRIGPVSVRKPTEAQLFALPLVLKNLQCFLPRIGELFTRYGSCLLPETKRIGTAAKLNPIALLDCISGTKSSVPELACCVRVY